MANLARTLITAMALISIGVNLVLALRLRSHREMFPCGSVLITYTLVAVVASALSAYWRLRAQYLGTPWDARDVTALILVLGSVGAGLWGSWVIGRHIGQEETKKQVMIASDPVAHLPMRRRSA